MSNDDMNDMLDWVEILRNLAGNYEVTVTANPMQLGIEQGHTVRMFTATGQPIDDFHKAPKPRSPYILGDRG